MLGHPRRASLSTLQVHVTRRCNLRCLHCYSSSGPEQRGELPLDILGGAIDDAAALGYGMLAVSGGEPMLYQPLSDLLARARRRGLATAVTTNGMLLDRRRLDSLRGVLTFLAVSLDGVPEAHDRMRANSRAFAMMAARLPDLRASGIPFGFLMTLTADNVHELDWTADFAAANGAVALQIHPLSKEGRAAVPGLTSPDPALAIHAARLAAKAQDRHAGRLRIVVDYLPWLRVPTDTSMPPGDVDGHLSLFADLVSPLVVEADGTVVPLAHGFARSYALGSLTAVRLLGLAESWIASGAAGRFRRLIQRVAAEVAAPNAAPLVSWADEMRRVGIAEEPSLVAV
jgi:MoaA/NifB/PqqE/SkfB family radical SAM enzyme